MNQDKMHLMNKIFNNETIRTVWDKEDEKYYISVIDVVGVLADSKEPRKYWNWLKNKLKKEEDFLHKSFLNYSVLYHSVSLTICQYELCAYYLIY